MSDKKSPSKNQNKNPKGDVYKFSHTEPKPDETSLVKPIPKKKDKKG